jgi:hypothetical protein
VAVGPVEEVFLLRDEMLLARPEAISRMRRLRLLTSRYWQAKTKAKEVAPATAQNFPLHESAEQAIPAPSQPQASFEHPHAQGLHPFLSETTFQDEDDQASFDEWMDMTEMPG